MRSKRRGATYVVQPAVRNICGASHLTKMKLSTPLRAQSSHPLTRNLACKTHAGAIARSDGC
eukprot:3003311-Pyramimonas_sp.AAC.1